jgi:hypothetical protein
MANAPITASPVAKPNHSFAGAKTLRIDAVNGPLTGAAI